MHIVDLLKKEYFILKITQYLNIVEIQNVLITFHLTENVDMYFMRECLSLMNFEKETERQHDFLNPPVSRRKIRDRSTDNRKPGKNKRPGYKYLWDIHRISLNERNNDDSEENRNMDNTFVRQQCESNITISGSVSHVYETEQDTFEQIDRFSTLENDMPNIHEGSFQWDMDPLENYTEMNDNYVDHDYNREKSGTFNKELETLTDELDEYHNNMETPIEETLFENSLTEVDSIMEQWEESIHGTTYNFREDKEKRKQKRVDTNIDYYDKEEYTVDMNTCPFAVSEEVTLINESKDDIDNKDVLFLKNLGFSSLNNRNVGNWEKLKTYLCGEYSLSGMDEIDDITSEEKKEAKHTFSNIWTYFHTISGPTDVKQKFNHFFEKDVSEKIYKNYVNVKYDFFQIYMYKDRYYCFLDLPWKHIYFNLNLNSICVNCNEKVLDTSNCIQGENISLLQASKTLLNYYMGFTGTQKEEEKGNKKDYVLDIDGSVKETESKQQQNLTNNDSEEDCKRRKRRYEKNDTNSNDKTLEIIPKQKIKKIKIDMNQEFQLIKMTHVLCEKCLNVLEYKHEHKDLLQSIKDDMNVAQEYGLLKKNYKNFQGVSFVSNYLILKIDMSDYILKSALILKDCVEKLRDHYRSIFVLSSNYYDNVIKLLLSCNDKRIRACKNFFINAFYVKHKNTLQLFFSPRVTFVKHSFLILEKQLPPFLLFFKYPYFCKLSKQLSADATKLIIKNISAQKLNELYDALSLHLYSFLNEKVFETNTFKEAYIYFMNIMFDWINKQNL